MIKGILIALTLASITLTKGVFYQDFFSPSPTEFRSPLAQSSLPPKPVHHLDMQTVASASSVLSESTSRETIDVTMAETTQTPTPSPLPTKTPTPIPTQRPTLTPVPSSLSSKQTEPTEKPTPTKFPTYAPVSTIVPPSQSLNADIILLLINMHRKNKNLTPFEKNGELCTIAQERGPELYDEIFVTGNVHEGLNKKNIPYWITENMAHYSTEEQIVAWWLGSSLHRNAIEGAYTNSCGSCFGNSCAQLFTNFTPKQ